MYSWSSFMQGTSYTTVMIKYIMPNKGDYIYAKIHFILAIIHMRNFLICIPHSIRNNLLIIHSFFFSHSHFIKIFCLSSNDNENNHPVIIKIRIVIVMKLMIFEKTGNLMLFKFFCQGTK